MRHAPSPWPPEAGGMLPHPIHGRGVFPGSLRHLKPKKVHGP